MTYVSGDILYQSIDRIAAIYNSMGAVSIASYDLENKFDAADAASIIDNAKLTAARAASIFDNTNLTVAKAASIFMNTNITIATIDDILGNENLSDSRASDIIYETDVATRDLSACSNVIGTAAIVEDWADNKLTSRDSDATTPILLASPFVQDANTIRPDWTSDAAGCNLAAQNQRLEFWEDTGGSGTPYVSISTTHFEGEWAWKWTNSGYTSMGYVALLYSTSGDYYRVQGGRSGTNQQNIKLYKYISSTDTLLIDTGTHTIEGLIPTQEIKLSRDSAGNFEIFVDGVSKGTVTDTDLTSIDTLKIYVTLGTDATGHTKVRFDDLVIT